MSKFKGEENRKDPRYDAEELRIILKDDKNFRGETLKNISLGGVFVRMETPYPMGTNLTLTLDPKLGIGTVKLEGEVVWASEPGAGEESGIGVKFKGVHSQIEEKLKKLFKALIKTQN